MIPYHVVSGMNGAVMVLPRGGLKDRDGGPIRYDKAYYVGEQDYYIPRNSDGKFIKYENPTAGISDVLKVMRTLTPPHVVLNGRVGALTGDSAMKAKVGETVLFIHSQANRTLDRTLSADMVTTYGSRAHSPIPLPTGFKPGSSVAALLVRQSILSGSRESMLTLPTT